ncbi:hypothetical protein [Haloferula sargassicola]|uniref:hypothetical protein n=1 Tax=Haloferula sargassicola TaxID=490096 RepID=UPI0033655B58
MEANEMRWLRHCQNSPDYEFAAQISDLRREFETRPNELTIWPPNLKFDSSNFKFPAQISNLAEKSAIWRANR